MKARKSNWPALDRAAFLIDHAGVPRHVPYYCAESAQLVSMLAAFQQQQNPSGGHDVGKK